MSDFSDLDNTEEGGGANSPHESKIEVYIQPTFIPTPVTKAKPKSESSSNPALKFLPKTITKKKTATSFRRPKPKSSIPILNKDTVNSTTYDFEALLCQKTQKICKAGHRMKHSNAQSITSSPAEWKRDIVAENISTPKIPSYLKEFSPKVFSSFNEHPKVFSSFNEPPKKFDLPDVDKRFYKHQRQTTMKIENRKKEQEDEEIASCSFKPSINTTFHSKTKRSVDEFYNDMIKHQQVREDKISFLREEKDKLNESKEKCKFKPTLCSKSMKILANKPYSDIPSHERLYQRFKVNSTTSYEFNTQFGEDLSREGDLLVDEPCTFMPAVNKKVRNVCRMLPVDMLLYNDALRRMSKKPKQENIVKFETSNTSINILVKRFITEFEKNIKEIDYWNSGQLNYSKFNEMFIEMKFLREANKKNNREIVLIIHIWTTYKTQEEFVYVSDLKVIMMGIMGYYKSWMKDPKVQNLVWDEKQVKLIHEKYKLLFENRRAQKLGYSTRKAEQTNKNDGKLQTKRNPIGNLKIEDYLIKQGELKNQRLKLLRQKKEVEAISEFSFQPNKKPLRRANTIEIEEETENVDREKKQLRALRKSSLYPFELSMALISRSDSKLESVEENITNKSAIDIFNISRRLTDTEEKLNENPEKKESMFDLVNETAELEEEEDTIFEEPQAEEETSEKMDWMALFKKSREERSEGNIDVESFCVSENEVSEKEEEKNGNKEEEKEQVRPVTNEEKKVMTDLGKRSELMNGFAKSFLLKSSISTK